MKQFRQTEATSHSPISVRFEAISRGPEDTRKVGRILGLHAQPGFIYLLSGELGTGKTCLTQGVLWGLGKNEYARSPTFVLVTQYPGRLTLYHIDLYRLDSIQGVLDLGLDEYLYGDGLCVVEWADKARDLWPEERLDIRMERLDEDTRRLTFCSDSETYVDAVNAVRSGLS